MAKQQHLLAIVLMASVLYAASSTTVYGILQQNNLPRGLIPQGVKSYILQPGGHLSATLPGECNFFVTVGGTQYKFRFSSSFSGIVQPGSIHEVQGVRVQLAYLWQGIFQVDHVGDQLVFEIGTSTVSFPIGDFTNSPACN